MLLVVVGSVFLKKQTSEHKFTDPEIDFAGPCVLSQAIVFLAGSAAGMVRRIVIGH
ncbi:hypothetical protein CBA19CS22_04255 [Caballeronia novacaledonica]|uniref:Uncharacterized protein n=1 Tax=Caballeronia novacaledonica TaxID=1544861 RepID=A0ACB5QLE5_9BURK|nr:hypothetical protein CBA19CS22_04255 [Caballeronia novacaledonica]